MKILILQLARLGDIYQTWPVLNALKRQNPGVEIHMLTRAKFAPAAPKGDLLDKNWILDTRDVLAPLIDEKPQIEVSLEKIDVLIESLREEAFDKIINLSFSPLSSFITREVTSLVTDIRGYTRTSDGFLAIPDDGSAFVHAQIGVGRVNRLHLTDIFAFVSDAELTEADWNFGSSIVPVMTEAVKAAGENPIVIHVGASDAGKTFSWSKWAQIVRGLLNSTSNPIVLVGADSERNLSTNICAADAQHGSERRPVNLVGQTTLQELFEIVRRSSLLIGGDSAPIHIASLTGNPVLNISFPMVSLWETGPRSAKSRILPVASDDQYSAEEIVCEATACLKGESTPLSAIRVAGPVYPYVEMKPQPNAFGWDLLKAIYMGGEFPLPPNETFVVGITRLSEVSSLAREQLATLRTNPKNSTATAILDRAIEIIEKIEEMVPDLGPIVRWFKTELLRLAPMPIPALIEATDEIYARLAAVVALYEPDSNREDQNDNANVG